MHPARIAALLEPFLHRPLSPAQLDQISTYIDLLLRWNARINLTAIRNPEEIVPRHFGESLFLARHLFPGANIDTAADPSKLEAQTSKPVHVLDLGSGAGFPALPIKIWAPRIHLTMIEANHKKAAFLREAARALTLTNVDVIAERIALLASRLPAAPSVDQTVSQAGISISKIPCPVADVVTFRAVEKFTQILSLATKFLAPHARLALLISTPQLPELQNLPTMSWQTINVPESQRKILALASPIA